MHDRTDTARRNAIKLGAATLAAAAAGPALAQNNRSTNRDNDNNQREHELQNAYGCFHIPVGRIDCFLIADGNLNFPLLPTFAANADQDTAQRQLRSRFLPAEGPGPVPVNALLIKAPDATILVDAGNGPDSQPSANHLTRHLRNLGVRGRDIDAAVITHMHSDHFGGFLAQDATDHLGNGDILISRPEREFWSENPSIPNPRTPNDTKAGLIRGAGDALDTLRNRLRTVPPNHRLAQGVRLVHIPGHTPGHVGIEIESQGEQLTYVTDLLHVAAMQFANPGWYAFFDTDPGRAVSIRREWYGRIATDRLKVAGTHLPFPATGHIRRDGNAYAFEPVVWTF